MRVEENSLSSHGSDPFTGMDVAMDDNSRLGTLSAAAPDVNSLKDSSLNRSSNIHDLRVAGETALKVFQELEMVGERVVSGEPALGWDWAGLATFSKPQFRNRPTSINSHLTLLLQIGSNILTENLAIGDESSQSIEILRRNNYIDLIRMSRVQDMCGEVLNLGLVLLGGGDAEDLEAVVVDLLSSTRDNAGERGRQEEGGGKNSLHVEICRC